MKPSKLLFIVAIAASLFLSSGATRAAEPGVYMLFVWGTATSDVRSGIEISEKKLEASFDAAGLTPSSRFVKGYKTLKGSDATGPNILSACREMADAAGPNDAILVYILSVGATLEEPDGRLRYVLAPCASSPSDLQLAREGIARDAIMATLKSKPHRLNVVVTDVSSDLAEPSSVAYAARSQNESISDSDSGFDGDSGSAPSAFDPYLVHFLLKARGNLDVNSTRPENDSSRGEIAKGFAPAEWTRVPSDPDKRRDYENYAGTVFTNAFIQTAGTSEFDADFDCSVDAFFQKLKARLNSSYAATKDYLKETGQFSAFVVFMRQETQTLTKFDDDGFPIQDDGSPYRVRHDKHEDGPSEGGFYL
ncbi:MAG: hypothetical protein IJL92_02525 [Thermoguttaceae bacterium]|nr:hypothetical protein [Thermoguttaceae bacterium]